MHRWPPPLMRGLGLCPSPWSILLTRDCKKNASKLRASSLESAEYLPRAHNSSNNGIGIGISDTVDIGNSYCKQ